MLGLHFVLTVRSRAPSGMARIGHSDTLGILRNALYDLQTTTQLGNCDIPSLLR
jgi:hypothetical protein